MMEKSDILIYQLEDGKTEINVQLDNETVWLNLNQIVDLFGRDKSVISRHINNIFKENELQKEAVVAKNATTASDGKTYQVDYYNLDVIISVGYRIKWGIQSTPVIFVNNFIICQRLCNNSLLK